MTLNKTVLVIVLTRVTKFILWANEKVFLEPSTVTHLNQPYESTSNQILNKVSIFNLHTCIKIRPISYGPLKELNNVLV